MTRLRSLSLLFAAAIMAVAMVACTAEANGGGEDRDEPVSSDGTATPGTGDGTGGVGHWGNGVEFERVDALAPIEEIDVLFLESFPVQHQLKVVSGLPGGCAAFKSIEVERDGNVFDVTVLNTMPAPDAEVACTMIYGYHESNVMLGDDLEAGTEYTVNVNGETITFVAG